MLINGKKMSLRTMDELLEGFPVGVLFIVDSAEDSVTMIGLFSMPEEFVADGFQKIASVTVTHIGWNANSVLDLVEHTLEMSPPMLNQFSKICIMKSGRTDRLFATATTIYFDKEV